VTDGGPDTGDRSGIRGSGRKPGRPKKQNQQRLNYARIGACLRAVCTEENEYILKDGEPYSVAAKRLGWGNSQRAKNHLRTIWKTNRGNVRLVQEPVSVSY
jgi:hypothetical protein